VELEDRASVQPGLLDVGEHILAAAEVAL